MKHVLLLVGVMTVLVIAPAGALAAWSDNFDGYADGTKLYNIGGWSGWDDDPNAAGTVSSEQALSAPHSISVSNSRGVDAVHPFTPYTSGAWTFTAYQYVPSDLDGLTYFILNNVYDLSTTPSTFEWAIEMHMDPATGMVNEQIHGGITTPLVYDTWVEIRVDFDLDLDTCDAYYNNVLLVSGTWTSSNYPTLEFANVDLYAPHEGTVYYDDLSLVPEPASLVLLALGVLALRRR
jgi:hypothetical protein